MIVLSQPLNGLPRSTPLATRRPAARTGRTLDGAATTAEPPRMSYAGGTRSPADGRRQRHHFGSWTLICVEVRGTWPPPRLSGRRSGTITTRRPSGRSRSRSARSAAGGSGHVLEHRHARDQIEVAVKRRREQIPGLEVVRGLRMCALRLIAIIHSEASTPWASHPRASSSCTIAPCPQPASRWRPGGMGRSSATMRSSP